MGSERLTPDLLFGSEDSSGLGGQLHADDDRCPGIPLPLTLSDAAYEIKGLLVGGVRARAIHASGIL